MKKKQLRDLEVSAVGLGCMGMTGFYGAVDRKGCVRTIEAAFEEGITLYDTADSYGFGENEMLLGSAVASFRNRIAIATKVGVARDKEKPQIVTINGKPGYIQQACEASLKRLGTSVIDLYYLHHLDATTPIEESMHAMSNLVKEGKIRYVGLGEMSAEMITRAHHIHPITAVQVEYSMFSRGAEKSIIPICKKLGIGGVACAPLSRGLLGGGVTSTAPDDFRSKFPRFAPENLAHNLLIIDKLRNVAVAKSCSLSQLALSWVASQSTLPLFGTAKEEHVGENSASTAIFLTHTEIEGINDIVGTGRVRGDRHPEWIKSLYPSD